jgi:hypothetical protein
MKTKGSIEVADVPHVAEMKAQDAAEMEAEGREAGPKGGEGAEGNEGAGAVGTRDAADAA